jgi:hypothetical protein
VNGADINISLWDALYAGAKRFMSHSAGQIAENSAGVQVHANEAYKHEKHVCVSCKQKVFLRRGKKVTKSGFPKINHFAHNATNVTKCSGYKGGETEQHLKAKKYVADNIDDFRFIDQSCDSCDTPNQAHCMRFSKDDWTVLIEGQITWTALGKGKPRRADILIQAKSKTDFIRLRSWYSIEIQHSHAVSMEKTKDLHMVGCGIIEVLASEVLAFKENDKPFYIRNIHSLCRIPWTCKKCVAVLAHGRMSRWLTYEEWYASQWVYQDVLNAKIAQDLEFSLFIAAQDLKISTELVVRTKKRKRLQAQAFQLMEFVETTKFQKTLTKCVGKCVACRAWIYHKNYHTFYATDDIMTKSERWWRDAVNNDDFLSNMRIVNKMIFCKNCISQCLHCDTEQPIESLRKYGLCRLCNTDNDWFDKFARQ